MNPKEKKLLILAGILILLIVSAAITAARINYKNTIAAIEAKIWLEHEVYVIPNPTLLNSRYYLTKGIYGSEVRVDISAASYQQLMASEMPPPCGFYNDYYQTTTRIYFGRYKTKVHALSCVLELQNQLEALGVIIKP